MSHYNEVRQTINDVVPPLFIFDNRHVVNRIDHLNQRAHDSNFDWISPQEHKQRYVDESNKQGENNMISAHKFHWCLFLNINFSVRIIERFNEVNVDWMKDERDYHIE